MKAAARPVRRSPGKRGFDRIRAIFRALYFGKSPQANRFRLAVIVIDFAIIGLFIAAPILGDQPGFLVLDYAIAAVLALEITARAMAERSLKEWIRRPTVWVDLFVLLTLLGPQWLFNLGFLRILRLWTLFHSELFWKTFGRRYDDTRWEDVTKTTATLVTFLFITAGFVFTGFRGRAEGLHSYIDALYFTVTSVTTTGYGDVLLPGPWGRLVSIVIMICGITLFVRLGQALFRPDKVLHPCPRCGLQRHDPDAVHCKACGLMLSIPDDG